MFGGLTQARPGIGIGESTENFPRSLDDDDDDDLYSFEKKSIGNYDGFRTAAGRALPTQAGYPGGMRTGRMPTATGTSYGDSATGARPMTSVRAAGYSSRGRAGMTAGAAFDPFNQAGRGTSGTTADKLETNPDEQIKQMEKKVNQLITESTIYASQGNTQLALEKAKEAGKKERALSKQREQLQLADQTNLDLTYCVLLNLADQYHANHMYQEALNSYAVIVKNKLFNQSGRLRVNMGNIYFEQSKFTQAVKMYRMALDQIPSSNKDIRLKIMRNIGIAFVRMGQFQDAITSFEAIMEGNPDYHTGFNLILCYFALGDRERMKRGFQKLVSLRPIAIEQNEDMGGPATVSSDEPIEDHEVFNEDSLRAIARERRKSAERYIILAAKLVAPNIENSFSAGYDWIVETIKSSPHADIGDELEIAKAIQFLKTKDFQKAIETLKGFEKKDQRMVGTAATNLSFMYFLEGEFKQAEKYADIAIASDRYNAKAQTNRGNCHFVRGAFDKAKEHYQAAIGVDAVCTEAMYNLGIVAKKQGIFHESLQWFEKLHAIMRNSAEVIYQIADIYDKEGNLTQAMEWFNILISVVPTDPGVLAKLGDMCAREGDKSQAFQYYSESYRYFPSNMDVIGWLGSYYVDCEVYEQAVQFFERAAAIQPNEVKWRLMVASCHRRSGNYQMAFETYKRIHEKFPDNVDSLRFLVRICTDLGMKEVQEYIAKLAKAEKAKDGRVGVEGTDAGGMGGAAPADASVQSQGRESLAGVEKINPYIERRKGGASQAKAPVEDDDWQEDVDNLLPE